MGRVNVVLTRLSKVSSIVVMAFIVLGKPALAQQESPTITVTVNKSIAFKVADRARRVSVAQPEVADVTVAAPTQLVITGKAVGSTSLIVFNEKGDVQSYDIVVTPDVA